MVIDDTREANPLGSQQQKEAGHGNDSNHRR